jgi:hypothetical protein
MLSDSLSGRRKGYVPCIIVVCNMMIQCVTRGRSVAVTASLASLSLRGHVGHATDEFKGLASGRAAVTAATACAQSCFGAAVAQRCDLLQPGCGAAAAGRRQPLRQSLCSPAAEPLFTTAGGWTELTASARRRCHRWQQRLCCRLSARLWSQNLEDSFTVAARMAG